MKNKFLSIFIFLLFGLIIIRMFNLMFLKNAYYKEELIKKTETTIKGLSAPRGRILDRYGNILVDNKGIKTIVYSKIPGINVSKELEIAEKLANTLSITNDPNLLEIKEYYYKKHKQEIDSRVGKDIIKKYEERKINSTELYDETLKVITEEDINKLTALEHKSAYIYSLMNKGYSYMDKIIKTNCTNEEYVLINDLNLPGIRALLTWERTYNYNDTIKEILGNVSSNTTGIPAEEKDKYLKEGYSLNDRVGISYLEKEYESYLKGKKAIYKINRDNTLTKIQEEERGNDLVLAIDINLQQELDNIMKEETLKAKKYPASKYYTGSYVVISKVKTGEILALSGMGIKNDNSFYDSSIDIITNSYTMGSAVKGASMTVGYQNGLIDSNKKVRDGCIKLKSKTKKCSWKDLGYLNDINALAYSSNYYQFLIAVKLTGEDYKYNMALKNVDKAFETYRKTFDSYGLGTKTGIDLPNEQAGQKGSILTDDLLLNLSIGQYDTYTPIELSQYINTIATGKRTKLSLMNKIISNDGTLIKKNDQKILNKIDIEEKDLKRIQEGFSSVSKYGTGASYVNKKYKAAGKTGTSESFLDSDLDGLIDVSTTTRTFAMYAPYDDPEYSFIIVSPHIGYENSISKYNYPINLYITKKVTNILFEKY